MKKLLIAASLLVSSIAFTQDYSDSSVTYTFVHTKTLERWVLFYINEERTKLGLDTFNVDLVIDKMAKDHSKWMARNNKLQHSGLNIRENIQDDIAPYSTHKHLAYCAVRAWIKSPSHYEAIQNPKYKTIGVGVSANKIKFGIYYTTTFR
jgi:uncharacterized protein YkwD